MLEIRNWLKWEVGLFNIHASDRDSSSVSGLSSLSLLQKDSYFFVANAKFLNVVEGGGIAHPSFFGVSFFGDIILIDIIVFFVFIDQVTCRPNQDKNSNLEQQHLVNVMSIHSSHDLLHFSGIFSLYSFSRLSIMPLHLDSQSPFQNPPQARLVQKYV